MTQVKQHFENYISIAQAAQNWNLSNRRVQALCASGKIKGAIQIGRDWMIPRDSPRPADGRTKAARSAQTAAAQPNLPFPRKTPFLYMSDLYGAPGTADESAQKLVDNHEAHVLFLAEVAYSRGQIDYVYQQATYLLQRHSGFYAVLSAGMLLALCAIWRGDLEMWRRAKIHIAEAPAKDDTDRDIMSLSISAVDSMLYDTNSFPEWFKIGCFEPLPQDALPAAMVFYAKYLYVAGYAVATRQISVEGMQGLSLMSLIPSTIEPMICMARASRAVIAEIYLRMTCAAVYRSYGEEAQALRHMRAAIPMALADGLYGFLAEYCRLLQAPMEQIVMEIDPAAWEKIAGLYQKYNQGWSKLSGIVRGRTLITTLTPREREVAKLAAFGMQNSEIAQKLHMSLSGVKQAIRIVSEKSGMGRDNFAAIL